jgi:hypothetical protein
MKRIVRLTESDMVRLIKKVLQEQMQQKPEDMVIECFTENMTLRDATKIPTSCMTIGLKVITSKRPPNPITDGQEFLSCANDLARLVQKDPSYAIEKITSVAQCIIKKASSPVMS